MWTSHQTAHTAELTNLFFRTSRTRIQHHENGIETLLVGSEAFHYFLRKLRIGMSPDINNLIVTLIISDESLVIILNYFFYFCVSFFDQSFFIFRNHYIIQIERQSSFER